MEQFQVSETVASLGLALYVLGCEFSLIFYPEHSFLLTDIWILL
jgi:hypothetical protein